MLIPHAFTLNLNITTSVYHPVGNKPQQASYPHWKGEPLVWDSLVPTERQWLILFISSHKEFEHLRYSYPMMG